MREDGRGFATSIVFATTPRDTTFPRPELSARCQCSQQTFAATRGNGRDAPIAAVRGDRREPGWAPNRPQGRRL